MPNSPKYQYWIDDFNRLVIQKKSKSGRLLGKSEVLNGRFELTQEKYLRFKLKTPSAILQDVLVRSNQTTLNLKGNWSLTSSHKLKYKLHRSLGELLFSTELIQYNKNKFVFSVTTKDNPKTFSTRLFQFDGFWQVDKNNRIVFTTIHRKSKRDRFLFQGLWELNRNHQIIYRYSLEQLKARKKKEQTLILKGSWRFVKKGFLDYSLKGDAQSRFRFRAQFTSHSHIRKDRSKLVFKVGVLVLGRKKRALKTIELFGRVVFYQKLTLGFEIEYERGVWEESKFHVLYKPKKGSEVKLELLNGRGKSLGIQMVFSQQLLQERGDFFVQAKKQGKEQSVFTGVRIPW